MSNFGYVNREYHRTKELTLKISSFLVSFLQTISVDQPNLALGFGRPTEIISREGFQGDPIPMLNYGFVDQFRGSITKSKT